ncbi:hypothetical protein GCM10022228_02410 [Halomonas cibimaris]|uniref:Secreted protein n=1 Tax=Halomonas cibimaris TaxID=657012 RepID=A0ABP7L7X0_9GAMM
MKLSMKHVIQTAAIAGALTLVSGTALADQQGENAVHPDQAADSANDPTDVQAETRQAGEVDPGDPVVTKQESTNSANAPSAENGPDGKLPEDDGLVDDHGVDSANVKG